MKMSAELKRAYHKHKGKEKLYARYFVGIFYAASFLFSSAHNKFKKGGNHQ